MTPSFNVLEVRPGGSFRLDGEEEPRASAILLIDGVSLFDRVRDIETPYAKQEYEARRNSEAFVSRPDSLAGAYAPPSACEIYLPDSRLMPDSRFVAFDSRMPLFECTCGCEGCWPFRCRIVVVGDEIEWSDFVQPHRPSWDYAALGTFRFQRDHYEQALARPA